jgi:hypothetical protein
LFVALSCAAPPAPSQYPFTVFCRDDQGQPLAGVKLHGAETWEAQSPASGAIKTSLRGIEGQVVVLRAECPEGYQRTVTTLPVSLRRFANAQTTPQFEVICKSLLRSIVVAVRAENGSNLPVTYLGEAVDTTDAFGAAHVLLKVPPEETLELALDTRSQPHLRPQNPSQRFKVPTTDQWLLLEQDFVAHVPKKKPRARPTIVNLRKR